MSFNCLCEKECVESESKWKCITECVGSESGWRKKTRLLIQTNNNKTLPSLSLFDLKKCSYLTGSGSVCPEHGAGSTGSFPQGGAGRAAGSYPRSQGCGAVLFSNLSFKMSKPPELRRKARKN